MRRILPGSIVSYSQYGHVKIPKDLKCKCPKCGKTNVFYLKSNFQENRTGLISNGNCANCKHTAQFIVLLTPSKSPENDPIIYINDESNPFNQNHNTSVIPDDLFRAYRSAINVHSIKDTSATAVMTKRVLEGIVKSFLKDNTEENQLSSQLTKLAKSIDFSKPLHNLSSLIEQDRKLYKALELEIDSDEEMSDLLIELLNALIEYLFILPSTIHGIFERIDQQT